MVQKTRLASLLGLGSALLLSGVAHAQTSSSGGPGGVPGSSPYSGAPSSSPYSGAPSSGYSGAPGASNASSGTVSNQQTGDSTTITSNSSDTTATDDSTLAKTGGEPWMMALAGIALAGGALTLRRRIN